MKQAEQSFGGTTIRRAWEEPEEVILQRAVVETKGLQPEDLGVLAALLLMDPGKPATAKALAAELRAMGWKVSLDRFEVIAKRLTAAGHMSRESVYDPETQRPSWVVQVYRNPVNNRPYVAEGVTASSQVKAEIGKNPSPASKGSAGLGKNPISPGQSEIGKNPSSGKTRDRNEHVSAGQGPNREKPESGSNPPHPPEEVTTSSPNPLTNTSGPGPAAPGEEEEEVAAVAFTAGELAAASHLLQLLPQPWSQGRPKAKRLAPRLLAVMADQGWPKILELSETDRLLLVRQLAKNPEKVNNYGSVLATDRIPNLPLYVTCRRPAVVRPRSETPASGSAGYCGDIDCDPITRTRESRDEAGLLRLRNCPQCHPSAPRPTAG